MVHLAGNNGYLAREDLHYLAPLFTERRVKETREQIEKLQLAHVWIKSLKDRTPTRIFWPRREFDPQHTRELCLLPFRITRKIGGGKLAPDLAVLAALYHGLQNRYGLIQVSDDVVATLLFPRLKNRLSVRERRSRLVELGVLTALDESPGKTGLYEMPDAMKPADRKKFETKPIPSAHYATLDEHLHVKVYATRPQLGAIFGRYSDLSEEAKAQVRAHIEQIGDKLLHGDTVLDKLLKETRRRTSRVPVGLRHVNLSVYVTWTRRRTSRQNRPSFPPFPTLPPLRPPAATKWNSKAKSPARQRRERRRSRAVWRRGSTHNGATQTTLGLEPIPEYEGEMAARLPSLLLETLAETLGPKAAKPGSPFHQRVRHTYNVLVEKGGAGKQARQEAAAIVFTQLGRVAGHENPHAALHKTLALAAHGEKESDLMKEARQRDEANLPPELAAVITNL